MARVGGAEIRRSDLGEFVVRVFPDRAEEALVHLVDAAVVEKEAGEFGMELPAGVVEEALREELRERENWTRANFGPKETYEGYLRSRYGRTLEQVKRDQRRLLTTQLLLQRQIRYRQIREDRVEVRDAVFADLDAARRAAESARQGADLGTLAKAGGVRPDVVFPPMSREEFGPPGLAELIWALAPGEVSEPVEVVEGGRKRFHVFKMIRRLPGREISWARARVEVEAGLGSRPVEKWEYLQWARKVREEYRLEILR